MYVCTYVCSYVRMYASIYLSIRLSVLSKDRERERTTVGNVDLETWMSSCMRFVHHPCLQCGNTTCALCKQMQERETSVLGLWAVICNTYVTLSTQSTCKKCTELLEFGL